MGAKYKHYAIIKDANDDDYFGIYGVTHTDRYFKMADLFCDAISDLFGEDFYNEIKNKPVGVPTIISIEASIKEAPNA